MTEVEDNSKWGVFPLAAISALVLCASSVLLIVRYSQKAKDKTGKMAQETFVEEKKTDIRILYGTQTGTAEKFSKQLATALNEQYGQHQNFVIEDIEFFDRDTFDDQEALFFLMATYGDGEPTDNAHDFMEWLSKKSEDVMYGECSEIFKGKPFAVFALGSSIYERFAATGKRVHKHLQVLGGDPVVPVGLGDDDEDIEEDFAAWLQGLMTALQKAPVFRKSDAPGAAAYPIVSYDVEILEAPGMSYEAGDHVAVFGQNTPQVVERACTALGYSSSTLISIALPDPNPGMLDPPFPSPTTLGAALTHHCELQQQPDREALRAVAAVATDPTERSRLLQIIGEAHGQQGSEEQPLAAQADGATYASFISSAQRSILDVLEEFPSAKPSLGACFARLVPRMRPRYYSISSSPVATPQRLSITAAVVDAVAPCGRRHRGVATTHLAAQQEGVRIPAALRASTFRLPRDAAVPVVMIGPGTGLAPFRGFLQERGVRQVAGETLGPALLFFGCRNPDHDFIYQEELEAYKQAGVITHLSVAFSRVTAAKEYVQHHVLKNKQAVVQALSAGGHLYVCGDAKSMAADVHAAVQAAVKESRACSDAEAKAFVSALQSQGRYMQDVW